MQTNSLEHFQPYTIATQSELEEAFHLWLESMQARQFSPNTLRGYRVNVGAFLRYLQENLNLTALDAVKPHHIRKWLIARQQHSVSNAQLHNDYRQPRTFWRWCIKEELTTNDPFAKVEKPKLQPTLKPALTPHEVEQILRACEGKEWTRLRDKALILLLLDTGLISVFAVRFKHSPHPNPPRGRGGNHNSSPVHGGGWELKGVGFLRACLLAEPPNRVFLSPCERDARAPSTRNAGNAGVPPAIPTAREKTYPFKGGWEGGMLKNQRKGTY
jgi:hypothetical protein